MVNQVAHQASEDRVVGDGDDVGHQPEVGLVVAVEKVDGGDVLHTIVRISETSRIKSTIARRRLLWEAQQCHTKEGFDIE